MNSNSLYLSDNDYQDMQNAAHIAKAHNISGTWSSSSIESDGAWTYISKDMHLFADNQHSFYKNVYDENGIYAFTIKIIILDDHNYLVLPVAYFQSPYYVGQLELYLSPKPSCYTLLGAHRLSQNPDAHVCITDDFAFYMENINNPKMQFLVNLGGDAWIDKLNFKFLKKHEVLCHAWRDDENSINSALKIAAKLRTIDIRPDFHLTSTKSESHQRLLTA